VSLSAEIPVIRIFFWCDLLPDTRETAVRDNPRVSAIRSVTAIFAFPPVGAVRTEHPMAFLQELYPDGKESDLAPADTSTEITVPSEPRWTAGEISGFNQVSFACVNHGNFRVINFVKSVR
jgi:hypothetical protein